MTVELSDNDLVMVWNLTQAAQPKGGLAIDALAALRATLRPLVEEIANGSKPSD